MPPMARRSLLILAVAIGLSVTAPAAGAHCIERHSVPIAKGASLSGLLWEVEGTIGNNGGGGSCREWLFGMEFNIVGALGWGSSTGIPAGGHRGRDPGVDASDDLLVDGSDRVFSGFVTGEVAKVVATLSNNKHLTVRPKLPPKQLRRKVVWLRNLRYFVAYYPPEGFVTGVASFSRSGQLLYRDKSFREF